MAPRIARAMCATWLGAFPSCVGFSINKLFSSITPEIIDDISKKDDFDFHTSSIFKLLGVKGTLSAASSLMSGELKKIIPHQG